MITTGVHWLAPASALGALLTGLLLMVGHHVFYQSLDGTAVSDFELSAFGISGQQINIAAETTFAFLAKACMVVAISISFVQLFWHAVHVTTPEAAPTLERVDSVYATLENAFQMFNIRTWLAHPLLMVVAGLAWLVPIAAVITPATLSIRTARVTNAPMKAMRVPNLDFTSTAYLAPMPDTALLVPTYYQGPTPYYYAYSGPSDDLVKIANAVVGDGNILPITPPALHTSWELHFNGPSLQCKDVDQAAATGLGQDLVDYLKHSDNGGHDRSYGYLGWYPAVRADELNVPYGANCSRPGFCGTELDPVVLNLGLLVPLPSVATLNRTSKQLQMMILTKSFEPSASTRYSGPAAAYVAAQDPALKLRSCQLYNATYRTLFDYSGGGQRIVSTVDRDPTDTPIHSIPGILHQYMSQQTDEYINPCKSPNAANLRCCYNDPTLLDTLSYQVIMEAFTRRFEGAVYIGTMRNNDLWGGSVTSTSTFFVNTTLMQTKLAQSEDLTYLRAALQSESKHTGLLTFQAALQTGNESIMVDARKLSVNATTALVSDVIDPGADISLSAAIEQMFQNLTISLMSSAALQPNYSSPTAPGPAQVTFHRFHNVYSYSAQKLWLPYGIAFGLSTVAVAIGLATMFTHGAAYSGNFSTILRAAHGAHMSVHITKEDASGQDPLPGHLARAKLWLPRKGDGPASSVTSERSMSVRQRRFQNIGGYGEAAEQRRR